MFIIISSEIVMRPPKKENSSFKQINLGEISVLKEQQTLVDGLPTTVPRVYFWHLLLLNLNLYF
jgi:hypothetical protein